MTHQKLSSLVDQSKELTAQPPCRTKRNLAWWKDHYGKSVVTTKALAAMADSVYRAVVNNDIAGLERFLAEDPTLAFTKIFGPGKRTALYVASMLGKVDIVRLLIARGADKHLKCEGVDPVHVAGMCTHDVVSAMKIKHLLGAFTTPQVLLRRQSCSTANKPQRFRVEIHFSEPIWDFVQDDIEVHRCKVAAFSMYREDFFVAIVQTSDVVDAMDEAHRPRVRVPPNVARRKHSNRLNDASPVLYLT
ncbi:hypothetical protein H310_06123 [Aphanomyces invadans]|uniref:Uncharacterized protein n=1 Tax=Aphanomyces invadans TaxID=157072 RepID=A0A024U8R0_9STRA|nr:hypothetical protein H310_06123 [Aphanomyces invadans]ETW02664.1 hypothetical protein H310_06123 [Aphanomyces invadans]|eukprot:XP_008869269.1 hypothetical protein H310_06123 [Aphanomyces invadans]